MKLFTLLRGALGAPRRAVEAGRGVEALRLAIGRQESCRVRNADVRRLRDAEFKVFSQRGEDGIIQHLVGRLPIENETFVEIGVEDYSESNTRFLLQNDNWKGLIVDAGTAHQRFLVERGLAWAHTIEAVAAFVTRENVNELIASAGIAGDIGLLSLDIDGNDYWVLEAISVVQPRILIVEYNSLFGPEHAITVPYDPGFRRGQAHPSHLFFGASLPAVCDLAARKGYTFVGSNSAGVNAFFVRNDMRGDFAPVSARDGWVESRFREARDDAGRLSYVTGHRAQLRIIADQRVVDVRSGATRSIGELFELRS
jgi:hypothetical protein